MTRQSHLLRPLEVSDWDKSLSHIATQMNNEPLNVHKLMANHPALLAAWWNFRNYSVLGGELGRRNGELVILRVASNLKSWYEWSSHVDRSLNCGLTLKEIVKVNSKLSEDDWIEKEYLLLSSVDILIKKKKLKTKFYNKMRKYFSDKQIMDIIAIHGMYTILACMINIYGLSLEKKIAKRLPKQITKKSFLKK